MGLFRLFSAVGVAFVLAGTAPVLAQGMPDDATRARVADWIEQCWAPSDACWPIIKRIEESALGRWCRAIEAYWDTARLVRDPETVLHSIEEVRGRREKAREFIEECVPIFAAALDEAGGGNDDSGDASYHGSVEPADRVMRAVERSNLRSGPGIGHDRVGLLDVGDEVRVTGVVGDWFRIEPPGGGEAFIYGPLLAEAPAPVTAWAEPAPEAPGLPADADPAPDTSRASSPDYMRFKAWTQPFCVAGNGAITMIPLADFYEAIDREICVGVVDIHKTATCDTRTAQCDWPCGGDPRCRNEWEVEPQWPYAGYADEARAVAEAAGEDPETMRADGLAKVREYPGKFLADTRVDADPPPTRGEPETPAVTAADSGQAGGLHGSIAFSQDDDGAYAWGIAWSFDSSAGAQSEALGQCREYGGTRCAEAGWFQEACGALAIGDGNGYGTGWGATTGEAERDALAQCRVSNDDCRIEVARCAQSEQAGGAGRTDSEDTAVSREPADTSDDSCGGWEATSNPTWNEEGLRRGGLNIPREHWGATKAEAEDYAQRTCSDYSNHSEYSLLLVSCVVGEARCVQPSGQQEAPAHSDAEPEQQDCRWFAYVWMHVPAGPDEGSYAVSGVGTTQTEAFDDAMGYCQAVSRGNSGSCAFADSCCVPNTGQAVFDPPCDPDPDR